MLGDLKLFSGRANLDLANEICENLSISLSQSDSFQFSEGNIYVKLTENVRRSDVFFIQSGCNPVNDLIMETLFFIDAFKRASAASITVILPYFPYTKGDKKDEPRVSIRAKVISEILEATGANRILTMDLQPPQIQGFFNIPVDNLYALPVFCDYLTELNIQDPLVVAPDFGAARMADNFARQLKSEVAIGNKKRLGHLEEVEVSHIIGKVKDRNVIIVDDMIISGGTLLEISEALKKRGALNIYACITHALITDSFVEKLEKSDIDQLIITNTVPLKKQYNTPKIKQLSVSKLFSEAISCIYHGDSIGRLFKSFER